MGSNDKLGAKPPVEEELKAVLARVAADPGRLAHVLDERSAPLIAFTANRSILAANVAAENFLGYGRHELDGRLTDVIVPERFRQPDAPPQPEARDLTTVEIPCLRRDGTESPTVWTFASVAGPGGPTFVLVMREPLASRERALEGRFRAVYENALDGIALLDDDLRIVDVNPAACRLLGSPREALIGVRGADLLTPRDRSERPEREERFRSAGMLVGEMKLVLPDGTIRRVEYGAVANVSPGLHMSMFRDIEDRKRTEETQRFLDEVSSVLASSLDSDETLASIARLAAQHISDWAAVDLLEEDGSIKRVGVAHVDPAKVALAQELRGRRRYSTQDPRGVGAVIRTGRPELVERITDEMLASAFATDPELLQIYRGLGFVSAMTVPLKAREQTVGALTMVSAESRRRYGPSDLVVAQEVARRAGHAIENSLFVRELKIANQKSDLFLRRAQHLQATATELVRADTVADIARIFESREPLSPVAAMGWMLFVTSDDDLVFLAATESIRETAARWSPIPLSTDNAVAEAARTGTPIWMRDRADLLARYSTVPAQRLSHAVQARAAIPLIGGDRCIGVLGVVFDSPHDFDEEERAYLTAVANLWAQAVHRARLAEAERHAIQRALDAETVATRRKDEFLAMLGHELRNPLSPIVTALALMRMRQEPTREQEVIERQVNHLVRLVDDLLDISRITRGKIELRKKRLQLDEAVRRGLEIASPLLERRRQRVDVAVPAAGLEVDGDVERLAQIVSNLLTNASKFSEEGATVRIDAERVGNTVRLTFRDEGIGIPSELLDRVFETFFQQPQSSDRARGGLGLGLAIVRSLVELHEGRVWATSEGPNKGSAFHVELPLATGTDSNGALRDTTASPAPQTPQLDAQQARRRILVVDDNEDVAGTLADFLLHLGHEVKTACDGVSALRIVKSFTPDICLLDIGLPAMDGYELARRLRQSDQLPAASRLIAITGYGQEADKQRSTEAGFAGHLVKPVSFEELSKAVAVGR